MPARKGESSIPAGLKRGVGVIAVHVVRLRMSCNSKLRHGEVGGRRVADINRRGGAGERYDPSS